MAAFGGRTRGKRFSPPETTNATPVNTPGWRSRCCHNGALPTECGMRNIAPLSRQGHHRTPASGAARAMTAGPTSERRGGSMLRWRLNMLRWRLNGDVVFNAVFNAVLVAAADVDVYWWWRRFGSCSCLCPRGGGSDTEGHDRGGHTDGDELDGVLHDISLGCVAREPKPWPPNDDWAV
jgi:hypothetical protein